MKQKLKLIIGITGFILLIGIAVVAYNMLSEQVRPDAVMVTQARTGRERRAMDFGMTDWDGNNIRLSNFIARGTPIVINFWASWCPPCVIEMPDFDRVYEDLEGEVQFIMLNLTDGMRETVEIGKRFIEEHNFSFPVLFDTRQEGARAYGIRSIPTSLFINRDGFIVDEVIGMIDEQNLRRRIALIQ